MATSDHPLSPGDSSPEAIPMQIERNENALLIAIDFGTDKLVHQVERPVHMASLKSVLAEDLAERVYAGLGKYECNTEGEWQDV